MSAIFVGNLPWTTTSEDLQAKYKGLQDEKEKLSQIWKDVYKPFHKLDAAKCSKCYRYYWEIEKYLYENNFTSKDIFYQTYNPQ